MRVALVHDYLKEFGGAERVLQALMEIFPEAPIYTSFCVPDSPAGKIFKNLSFPRKRESRLGSPIGSGMTSGHRIITSWGNKILPKFHLYSVLRFLTPLVWESFNFDAYDLVISSSSWYITKGIKVKKPTVHICYCHTPPRWLYGYQTPIDWKKFWPIRLYGEIVGHFLRQYDYQTSQRVDYFIANSKEVAGRIKKFYRREATVIYPPIEVFQNTQKTQNVRKSDNLNVRISENLVSDFSEFSGKYFLVVSRLEGAKKIDLAIEACNRLGCELWVVGTGSQEEYLKSISGPTIKFLGRVEDENLGTIYQNCKALICTAVDEDFGITPVEAMAAGRPVIAFRGGGYLETVVEGKTGLFYPPATPALRAGGRGDEPTVGSLIKTITEFKSLKFKAEDCRKQAEKFGKDRFKGEIVEFTNHIMSSPRKRGSRTDSETSSE